MKSTIADELRPQFSRFREGDMTAAQLQQFLNEGSPALAAADNPALRTVLEQANARIEFILWGVCEAERDAHINELLQELEVKVLSLP